MRSKRAGLYLVSAQAQVLAGPAEENRGQNSIPLPTILRAFLMLKLLHTLAHLMRVYRLAFAIVLYLLLLWLGRDLPPLVPGLAGLGSFLGSAALVMALGWRLWHSEQLFRELVEEQSDGIARFRPDGVLTFTNPAFQELFGRRFDDLIGMRWQALGLYDDAVELPNLLPLLSREAPVLTLERQVKVPDCPVGWAQFIHRGHFDASGQLRTVQVLVRDITQPKWLETQLVRTAGEKAELYRTLEQRSAELRTMIDNDLLGMARCRDRRIVWASPGFARLLGYPLEAVVGMPTRDLYVSEAAWQDVGLRSAAEIAAGRVWQGEFELRCCDGRFVWADARGIGYAGATDETLWLFSDVTRRKQVEEELASNRELLQVTLESIGDAVITTDPEGQVRWLNPVAEALTGWPEHEALHQPLSSVLRVVDEDDRQPLADPVARCLREGKIIGLAPRTVLLGRDGTEHGIEDSIAPMRDPGDRIIGTVLVFRDVTEQRRLAREIEYRATHDALTELHNRSDFEEQLSQLLLAVHTQEQTEPNALLYVDLDQFKQINDSCGHTVGDQLLRQIAAMLRHTMRSRDLVARLGGDKFGILLRDCTQERARALANQICQRMSGFRFHLEGRRIGIAASIGLVMVDGRWTSAIGAIEAADNACASAKDRGRNQVGVWVDTEGLVRSLRGRMQWSERLEGAMVRNDFRLFAQYLPSTDSDAHPPECEILLRLPEPGGGWCPPGAFIPLALRYQLMSRIDRWVLRQVLRAMAASTWPTAALPHVSLNISSQSLIDPAFSTELGWLLADSGVDPQRLCFELDETVVTSNLVDACAFAGMVHACGARVAVDNFGGAPGCLDWLEQIGVDVLKIDPVLLAGIPGDGVQEAGLRYLMAVAGALDARLIAKSVEQAAQAEALHRLGVTAQQGHLRHPPEALEALLTRLGGH